MERRRLGASDLEVSRLGIGGMQFGWTADEEASFTVLDAYVEAGGNFIDTADIYTRWVSGHAGGESESIIGRWLAARGSRDGLVVATKVRGEMWDGRDGQGLGRAHIIRACEDSLRRLQVETIDLYQCHWFDEKTPFEETARAFEELRAAGKVRYFGASNYDPSRLSDALETSKRLQLPGFVSLQPHYNLAHRDEFEGELRNVCSAHGLAVLPYSPLGGGFLTGKYRPGEAAKSRRATGVRKYYSEHGWAALGEARAIAEERSVVPGVIAVAWLLAQPGVTAPIVGANSVAQLESVLPAAGLALTDNELARLDAASRPNRSH